MQNSAYKIALLIGTFLGVGYFPVASGTAATAAGLLLIWLLQDFTVIYVLVLVALFILGLWAADVIELKTGETDPGIVVVDEIVGIMIALMGLPLSTPVMVVGFFLFRALDMFKIYPINRMEQLKGGWGVMMDDVVAGLMTNIILSIAVHWAGIT